MKKLVFIAMVISLNTFGASRSESFECYSDISSLELKIEAKIQSTTNYQISVTRNGYPTFSNNFSDIVFHSDGEITAIKISAHTDVLTLYSHNDSWLAEFWNDNVYYDLKCERAL